MTAHLQGSLFDQTDEVRLGALAGMRRTTLGHGAWIDELPGWLHGADALFELLAAEVPWRAERRTMYDHVVDVPRLLAFYGAGDDAAAPGAGRGTERALRALRRRARGAVHHGRALLLPRRARQRRLARGPDRARRARGHHGRDSLRGHTARPPAAPGAAAARRCGVRSGTAT